jgi:hypothetical protein
MTNGFDAVAPTDNGEMVTRDSNFVGSADGHGQGRTSGRPMLGLAGDRGPRDFVRPVMKFP